MRLAAVGMRLDSVETALRQNPTCAVQHYADARVKARPLPELDFTRRADRLPPRREFAPGSLIRDGNDPPDPICRREMLTDRNGVIDPARVFLHGDLAGLDQHGIRVARDLGPAANAVLVRRYADRPVYLLRAGGTIRPVTVEPYVSGIARLWAAPAGPGMQP
jgi:hypothetical protein